MYDLIPFICGVLMLGLGAFMTICPKQSTKKNKREDENEVAKVKKSGIILIVCSIVLCIFGFIRFTM